ncbi:DUF1269 domain-containing protein [Rhodopirellula sp. MGV]|uniref:DUF1269 domain-containing protein n=1 Tax=Rhodopirellula sp. MGV TaxID=2023130 RepID=UPI000B977570|nr:DUF1269 domain-containing protein [Rhodopirellula sp. MGV]OYP38264.1 hypothetical protein CGZ80_03345 [Rhodopirellula sp. MGV]PNY38602.1 DUF1269 domain-containing protein [Rhodopirellula baltica]
MNDQCVVAQYSDEDQFHTAIEVLDKAGFTADEVSLIQRSSDVRKAIPSQGVAEVGPASDGAASGAATAGATVAGGAVGTLLGTATLLGPLMIAGPLAGMAAGAVGGGVLSAAEKWGVEKDVASTYEQAVEAGDQLIVVATDDVVRIDEAQRLLHTVDCKSLERYPG